MTYPINRMYLSPSSMELFRSCPRKFEFRKLFRRPKRDRAFDAEVGIAIHAGYQKFIVTGDKQAAMWEMMKAYPIDLEIKATAPKSLEACYATMQAMMSSYSMAEYQIVTIKCLDGVERPAVEVPFMIVLKGIELIPGIEVCYIGYIDLIAFSQMKARYEVLDIKTHRNNLTDLTPEYKWHEQVVPYTLAVETTVGHELEVLPTNYLSCYIDIENPVISRYSFDKTKEDLHDWARGLLIDLQNMKMFIDMEWFPRRSNSCSAWRRKCEYFDLCSERDLSKINAWMLEGQEPYEEIPFDPWLKIELDLAA